MLELYFFLAGLVLGSALGYLYGKQVVTDVEERLKELEQKFESAAKKVKARL